MEYSKKSLQYGRPQGMYDSQVHRYISEITKSGENFGENPYQLFKDFKGHFHKWILGSKLNSIEGLGAFPDRDIITGVTHFLDDIHQMKQNIFVLKNDYAYHCRLYGDSIFKKPSDLKAGDNLILSLPFPYYGDFHPETYKIFDICNSKNIDVHIDSCWLGCCRDIIFDYDQPCIKSIGFSLSKSLGLGANRIGVRYARKRWVGPVSIMNDFSMVNQCLVWMGLKFIQKFGSDFWQNKYGERYKKICKDFKLTPSKAIHIAFDAEKMVGLRPLLRMLPNE